MTETIPFRLRLGMAITDTLKAIAPVDGYHFDLRDFDPGDGATMSRVYRGRAWFGDTDPIPMVSILEAVNPADELMEVPVDMTAGEFDWSLIVQGFVSDDPENPTDPAYWLERDVRTALGREKRRMKPNSHSPDPFGASTWQIPGCGVIGMTLGLGVIRPADDVSSKAYFWLPLTLRLVEALEAA